jgi:aliphatic nitrilase
VSKSYPTFKAAACHAAPVYRDTARTIDKALSLIAEAARNGASLVAFPESFVPCFPIWAALRAPILNHGQSETGEGTLLVTGGVAR